MHTHCSIGAGDALLFFDQDIAGQKGDRKALHSSCPTLKVWLLQLSYIKGVVTQMLQTSCQEEVRQLMAGLWKAAEVGF